MLRHSALEQAIGRRQVVSAVTGASQRRARSFDGVAAAYEEARPGYPSAALDWLLPSPVRVLELGAGTGKLTRQMVAAGHDVLAVEPSGEMLAQLRLAVPAAEALVGAAESIPLADASVDAVVAAQAFHWFDPRVALPEIRRVLRSHGRLGLMWNIPDADSAVIATLAPIVGGFPSGAGDPASVIAEAGGFGPLEAHVFRHEQQLTRERLVDLARSWSSVAVLAEGERERRLVAISRAFDALAQEGTITFPYLTYTYFANVV